jgi:molybdopterin/thiamine biosynthesis adenylyltransferase
MDRLSLNTIIKPIFKVDNSYFYKYNNDFVEIGDIELTEYFLKIFQSSSYIKFEDLINLLQKEFKISQQEANELIEDLLEVGFLTEFKNKDRYTTNELFFSLFDNYNKLSMQQKLNESEVCILGLGGSTLIIQQLAQIGIGKITGLDFDTLEESNLNRQVIFKENDVGNLKSEILAKNLKEINSNIIYDFRNIYVDSQEKISDIISTADIIVLALDEPIIDSSIWVFNECKKQHKKIISGGVWGDEVTYTFFDYSLPNQPCYTCLMEQDLRSDKVIQNYISEIKGKKFANFNTTTIFVGSILAGIIATEIVKLLTNYSPPIKSGSSLTLNTTTWKLNVNEINVNGRCQNCLGELNGQ